nr:putative ribonuclease H protein At1g65750 family [Tanacetum cinerariifolium]
MKLVNEIHKLEREQKDDLIQKSQLKWCVEGDENSKFFHGTLNRKRKQLSVRGIKLNGLWVEDPMAVKQTFFNHFSQKFAKVTSISYSTRRNHFRLFRNTNSKYWNLNCLWRKVKDARVSMAWARRKPQGLPISLIGILYKIIAKIIACRIALIIDDIVDPVQSAFIKNRQILDGPMILNELERDLRQRDPLAPFLFILAMEGLYIAMEDAIEAKKFSGIHIGDICLSHLIYADDVIVLGEWSHSNLVNILDIFNCFYLASGLQISVMKSKLYGIGVTEADLNHFADLAGCKGEKLSFMYLGLPIGANMSRVISWQPVIDKFTKRLSK